MGIQNVNQNHPKGQSISESSYEAHFITRQTIYYKAILRGVRVTNLAVEMQWVLNIMSVLNLTYQLMHFYIQ